MLQNETKNAHPLHVSLNISAARYSFKKYVTMYFFDQVTKDVIMLFTFSRWHLEAELRFKMAEFANVWIFWISALPLDVTLHLHKHSFGIFGHLVKNTYRFSKDIPAGEMLRQTCKGLTHSVFFGWAYGIMAQFFSILLADKIKFIWIKIMYWDNG